MYRGSEGVSDATLLRKGQCKETFANTGIRGKSKEETRYGKTVEVVVVNCGVIEFHGKTVDLLLIDGDDLLET